VRFPNGLGEAKGRPRTVSLALDKEDYREPLGRGGRTIRKVFRGTPISGLDDIRRKVKKCCALKKTYLMAAKGNSEGREGREPKTTTRYKNQADMMPGQTYTNWHIATQKDLLKETQITVGEDIVERGHHTQKGSSQGGNLSERGTENSRSDDSGVEPTDDNSNQQA